MILPWLHPNFSQFVLHMCKFLTAKLQIHVSSLSFLFVQLEGSMLEFWVFCFRKNITRFYFSCVVYYLILHCLCFKEIWHQLKSYNGTDIVKPFEKNGIYNIGLASQTRIWSCPKVQCYYIFVYVYMCSYIWGIHFYNATILHAYIKMQRHIEGDLSFEDLAHMN